MMSCATFMGRLGKGYYARFTTSSPGDVGMSEREFLPTMLQDIAARRIGCLSLPSGTRSEGCRFFRLVVLVGVLERVFQCHE